MTTHVSSPLPRVYVDASDVLFLIVKHLRACGLAASAMALLRESGIDTAWLCGAAREIELLREWVFTGDFARVRALLAPLAALSQDELSASIALVDKQERLEAFFESSDPRTRRAMLDELRAHQHALRLSDAELALCVDALLDTSALEPSGGAAASRWNALEARMQCFQQLVPVFRGAISHDDAAHKYLAMPSTQLVGLVHDALTFHHQQAQANSTTPPLDCISVCTCSLVDSQPQSTHLFLRAPPSTAQHAAPQAYTRLPSLSRSADFSGSRRSWLAVDASSAPERPISSAAAAATHSNPLAMSLDFGRARARPVRRTQQPRKREELIVEMDDDDESDDESTASGNALARGAGPDEALAVARRIAAVLDSQDACTQTEDVHADSSSKSCDANSDSTTATAAPSVALAAQRKSIALSVTTLPVNRSTDAAQCRLTQSPTNQVSELRHNQEPTHSIATNASQSLCLDGSDAKPVHEPTKSPISKYLDEEEAEEEQQGDLEDDDDDEELSPDDPSDDPAVSPTRNLDNATDALSLAALYAPEQQRRPERYDQLTLDHIVQASVVAEVKEAHAVRAIDLSSDGSQLAIGTNARALRVFDVVAPLASASHATSPWRLGPSASSSHRSALLPLLPVLVERHKHHQSSIYCVAYNHSSTSAAHVLATGDADSSIKVLSLATNREVVVPSRAGKTRALHFASDRLLWTAGSSDLRIRCWDLESASKSSCLDLDGHVGEVQALAFVSSGAVSTSSSLVMSAALDKTLRLWDARSGKCERLVARVAHAAFALAFDPSNSSYVASGHQDGSVQRWDVRTARSPLETLLHHRDECRTLSWSPDGAWLVSSSFDGTICVLHAASQRTLSPLASFHQHQDKVLQAQWHPTTPAIVTTGADKLVKLWAFGSRV